MRALTPQSSGFGLALLLPGAAFSGVKTHVPSPLSFATSSLRSRAPRLAPKKQPSAGPGAEAHRDRMSGPVQVFGCRHAETIPTLGQPASEKRQGRKSRGVGHQRCSGAMGIWRRRECWGSCVDAVDRIALARILGVRAGANERIARCSTGFAVRSRGNLADRSKRVWCRARAGQNGALRCGAGSAMTAS